MRGVVGAGADSWGGSETDHRLELHSGRRWNSGLPSFPSTAPSQGDDGLIPAGFAALDKLRIEAGLILFGNEFDGQQDPFEAGIGFAVPLKTKEANFIGKDNLKERKLNPQKKLVGLELIGKEAASKEVQISACFLILKTFCVRLLFTQQNHEHISIEQR